ncbi:5-(carboxyamino)imidazole ribonucleotide synthase [Novosphingopyxis sp.]|uniref:5-(carboxyamino)imidazole ribonucleotide synthase n=1 Tax=Novosphingopyxis sp. TaxID=2709690 RepID=UPI003B5C4A09
MNGALAPSAVIGILGGGQLGRMLAMAAAQIGYRCHIFAPQGRAVAADVAVSRTTAAFEDEPALARFAEACDVLTYEFENVPTAPLLALGLADKVRPGVKALDISQSRIAEKSFFRDLGARTAPFAFVEDAATLKEAIAAIGAPAILKTDRMGYDGKGQARITDGGDAPRGWESIGRQPAVMEGFVTFEDEFSVILVRAADGEIRFWDSTRNVHEDGILRRSLWPAGDVVEAQIADARALAGKAAEALDAIGVLTFEFFATADGPLFNECAPRVHNSGHWTIEGAVTSQFENHIRAIAGLPLGACATVGTRIEMSNLIGEQINDSAAILADPAAHLHHYGKADARPGRKMGHVTKLYF